MKRILTIIILFVLFSAGTRPARADGDPIEIWTADDLLKIAENPSETYCLMADIDMDGIPWPAFTFTGELNGHGQTILNLNTFKVSDETRVTYDGNRKTYDTHFAGLFAIMENASVHDLRLINVSVTAEYEGDCFLGTIAGYMSDSRISNCEISGTVRLDVNGKMFGVGGVFGYGNGVISNATTDVTLINIDLDSEHRDEQFLGGICGAGYPDMDGNTVRLAGFISDHGYVHSGGLVGMYIIYPKRFTRNGYIKNNTLDGVITFFEDNTDRRAYCEARCGEIMDWVFTESGNVYRFKRDERFVYTENLLPHPCDAPDYEDVVTAPTCTEPGFVTHTCRTCGYVFRDTYTLPTHTFSDTFRTVIEPTLTETGLAEYTCTVCGAVWTKKLPMLTPSPTPSPIPSPTQAPSVQTPAPTAAENTSGSPSGSSGNSLLLPVLCGLILLLAGGVFTYTVIRARRTRR